MSQVLTVPTHFNDIGELSDGFLDRVERDTLILYGPVPYEDGSAIEFAVLLADGTSALEGSGRVRAAVDGGAERVPETRYDVVVEALVLQGRFEVVFERLVMARQAVSENPPPPEQLEPTTGEMEAAAPESDTLGTAVDDTDDDSTPEFQLSTEEVVSVAPDELVSVLPGGLEEEAEASPPSVTEVRSDSDLEGDLTAEAWVEEAVIEDDDDMEMEMSVEEADPQVVQWEDEPPVELSIDAEAPLETDASSQEAREPAEPLEEPADVELVRAFEAGDEPLVMTTDEPSGETLETKVVDEDDEALVVTEDASMEALEAEVDEEGEPLVAAEPNVGAPVPKPTIAAPPEAPPAPGGLNVVAPPEGLTRPSRAMSDDSFVAGSDSGYEEEHSGMFEYEEGLPIPSRPPLPDLDPARRVAAVEASPANDVEESEPPEAHEDYEEIRLSELAESAEEG